MTPERLEEIRKTYYDPLDPNAEWRVPVGQHINNAEELLEEVDRLRELRINSQLQYDITLEEYAALKQAAEPFIRHSAKLISQSFGKTFMAIEVPVEDVLNLRKVLKGE